MLRIGLIDVDGHNFPNLPLMKLSAWHKQEGNLVEWYFPFSDTYDLVYKSKVFSFTPDFNDAINARVVLSGGTGYALQIGADGLEHYNTLYDVPLPDFIEHIYPDYSLYPKLTKNTAYGFLSRGCPRGCEFCHVAEKEGKLSVKVADLSEFWRGQKNIVLCDPNILACREWESLLQQLADSGAYVDFNQGLDARLMTPEKAQMLSRIKTKEVHFAWDRYEDKEFVLRGLEIYREYNKTTFHGHHAIVYTLVNFDTLIQEDYERIYALRKLGYWPFVMIYDKEHANKHYKRLARWCNNRKIFAQCERFEDYKD